MVKMMSDGQDHEPIPGNRLGWGSATKTLRASIAYRPDAT